MKIELKETELLKIETENEIKPQENRKIQSLICFIFTEYTRLTGKCFINLEILIDIFNYGMNLVKLNYSMNYEPFIELMAKKYNFEFDIIKVYNKKILKIPEIGFIIEPKSFIIREQISKYIEVNYFYEIPIEYRNKINELRKRIELYEETEEVSYLTTNPLNNSIDISRKIGEIIQNSNKFLYFSLPYYDYDINFLINLLDEKLKKHIALKNTIDFRILYRDEDSAKNFVIELSKKIKDIYPAGFWKKFSKALLTNRVSPLEFKRIGNLHSKMIISDYGLLIGSANLTNNSLVSNYETAIFSNKSNLIIEARKDFEQVWGAFNEPPAF